MIRFLYSLYDSKTGYMAPTDFCSDVAAVRSLEAAVIHKTETFFDTHPEDFSLFRVAEFDTSSGRVMSYNSPVFVESVSSVSLRLSSDRSSSFDDDSKSGVALEEI
ncbi:nonstructural protein [Dipodfec virus UOA04_Rod_815]|nr:nonstructural protein [Dipodfec virus UOA04_Rod_815]